MIQKFWDKIINATDSVLTNVSAHCHNKTVRN